ncbi:LA-RELATED PROTEIN 1B [Salix purpurea]|uniref:LA-RELATED PROTEIN 1B n=1 Tax=Salix purpurea TaxID=77065 RepID=A0A9Q1AJL4_SALPP|nr:LA-RELATED PROTEIN 1B [Salix purpurea]
MVYTVDSSNSPRFSSDGVRSPQRRKKTSSPKSETVTGEAESINSMLEQSNDSAAIESLDSKKGNAGKAKKPAWNKPTPNGVAEIISPVMDATSWPALSESTKPSPKPSPAESSSKIVSDGSTPTSQGPVIANSPKKQGNSNAKSNSATNHTMPVRQRPVRRGGGGGSGSSSGGGHSQNSFTHPPPPPPPPPPFPIFPMPPNGFSNLVPAMPDQSPREPLYRGNNWEPRPIGGFVPPQPVVSEYRRPRRGNFGQPPGDGSHRNNYAGRREQDRGHHGNARDAHVQQQRAPTRGFPRPSPPNSGTFIPPQSARPFANPMGYTDMLFIPPPITMEPYPVVPHMQSPTMLMPIPQPLPLLLLNQIEYYFSDINLSEDGYLKSRMDDEGWVPITLIAGFNRVRIMTNNIQFILECLRTSSLLEVQDDKVRRRNDWMNWLPSSPMPRTDLAVQSSGASSSDTLTASFQKISVEDAAADQDSTTAKTSELTIQAGISHQEEDAEGTSSST